MTLIVSEKQGPHGLLLVVTDKDILGKQFEEGKVWLDLTKKFYEGEEQDKEYIKNKITDARDLHFTGKEAIAMLVELDLINSERILWVQGVPHIQGVIGE
jgi:hypothetical protein